MLQYKGFNIIYFTSISPFYLFTELRYDAYSQIVEGKYDGCFCGLPWWRNRELIKNLGWMTTNGCPSSCQKPTTDQHNFCKAQVDVLKSECIFLSTVSSTPLNSFFYHLIVFRHQNHFLNERNNYSLFFFNMYGSLNMLDAAFVPVIMPCKLKWEKNTTLKLHV